MDRRDIEPDECDDGRGEGMVIEMLEDDTNDMAGFGTNGGYVGAPVEGRCEQDTKIAEDMTVQLVRRRLTKKE